MLKYLPGKFFCDKERYREYRQVSIRINKLVRIVVRVGVPIEAMDVALVKSCRIDRVETTDRRIVPATPKVDETNFLFILPRVPRTIRLLFLEYTFTVWFVGLSPKQVS